MEKANVPHRNQGVELFVHKLLQKSETTKLTDDEIKALQDVGVEYVQGEIMEIEGLGKRYAPPGKFHKKVSITPKFDRIADDEYRERMEIFRQKRGFRWIG